MKLVLYPTGVLLQEPSNGQLMIQRGRSKKMQLVCKNLRLFFDHFFFILTVCHWTRNCRKF